MLSCAQVLVDKADTPISWSKQLTALHGTRRGSRPGPNPFGWSGSEPGPFGDALNPIDAFPNPRENALVKPIPNNLIPSDALADLEYASRLQAAGQRDPGFEKKVGEQTEVIRQEILAEHGVLNIAVDLVREGRDEE